MNFISLPNGFILNLDQVSCVSVRSATTLVAYFATSINGAPSGTYLKSTLKDEDAKAFLAALSARGVDVSNTVAAMGRLTESRPNQAPGDLSPGAEG